MNVFVLSYVKMIEHGICTIQQIPQEYRELVKRYMSGEMQEIVDESSSTTTTHVSPIHGALHIPNIENVALNTDMLDLGVSVVVGFDNKNIFVPKLLETNPFPNNLEYSIERIENVYGKFEDDIKVELKNRADGFDINVRGTPKKSDKGLIILRVDLRIKSSNYEDMRLTIYFVSDK